jgi:hypothetical protein
MKLTTLKEQQSQYGSDTFNLEEEWLVNPRDFKELLEIATKGNRKLILTINNAKSAFIFIYHFRQSIIYGKISKPEHVYDRAKTVCGNGKLPRLILSGL